MEARHEENRQKAVLEPYHGPGSCRRRRPPSPRGDLPSNGLRRLSEHILYLHGDGLRMHARVRHAGNLPAIHQLLWPLVPVHEPVGLFVDSDVSNLLYRLPDQLLLTR